MLFEQSIDIDAEPERVWEVLSDLESWSRRIETPSYFEWRQKPGGITNVATHRVEALDDGRSRLTLTIGMRGFLVPVFGRMFKGLTNEYMTTEAESVKRAAESPET